MYIVFEGIDLVGKSTQIKLLQKLFPEFIYTREPGGTQFGQKIRDMILHQESSLNSFSEFLLFLADRSEHYHQVLKPNLEMGKVVVSDRSMISGIAYASINGGIDEVDILSMNLMSVENLKPDLIIFLHISRENLLLRKQGSSEDNIEMRGVEYSLNVQTNLEFWIDKLELNVLKIDASHNIDYIFNLISQNIKKLLI